MQPDFLVYRSLEEVGPEFAPSALTIGNFDGAHLGHQEIFRRVVRLAADNNWNPSVLTFHPHPAKVVAPERALRLLSTPEQRCEWMRQAGIRQVFILPFDEQFSRLTPEEFVESIVIAKLGARAVLVGQNFRFGYEQAGDPRRLAELAAVHGFTTEVVTALRFRNRLISSSEIRRLICAGKVSLAARLLGRAYSVAGEVTPGRGVGSRLTVPTLNLHTAAEVLPPAGVYITRTQDLITGQRWPSVTNVGHRPTFGGGDLSVESFLLEPIDQASPGRIRVEFLYRLREEMKFETPERLKSQILRDASRARAFHARLNRWVRPPGRHTRLATRP